FLVFACGRLGTGAVTLGRDGTRTMQPQCSIDGHVVARRPFAISCSRMRDLFEEIFANQPLDPVEAARRAMRPQLRRRFYQRATVAEGEGGFAVALDGRP